MELYRYLNETEKAARKTEVIGHSVLGREIKAYVLGKEGAPKVLIHGAIHAREYITARLVAEFAREYRGEAEIWFVPLVNPDGVELVMNGLYSIPEWRQKGIVKFNGGTEDFSLWKANIRGVDLNVNFDALWGTGKDNINYPSLENYIGPYPFSEPEARALKILTKKQDFKITISYHTKGEEIYWGFDNNYRYYKEALEFSRLTGYPLLKSEESAGGYKDWFVQETGRLGLTVEAGADKLTHPLDDAAYPEIWEKNKDVAALAGDICLR